GRTILDLAWTVLVAALLVAMLFNLQLRAVTGRRFKSPTLWQVSRHGRGLLGPGEALIPAHYWAATIPRWWGGQRAASGTGFTGLRHPNRGQICRNCVKLRLTMLLPVGATSLTRAGPAAAITPHPPLQLHYNDLTGRPEEAPNPSIRASVPS